MRKELALRTYFYIYNFFLTETQVAWLADDGCAGLAMLANGGTYCLDYCRLTVTTSIPACDGDFDLDRDVDPEDLITFADYFGRGDCIGVFHRPAYRKSPDSGHQRSFSFRS